MAKTYLDGFDEDPLLNHPDIRQYDEPNFVGKNGRFYLCRCYSCGGERGTDNWYPSRASGRCFSCGWKPDTEIVAYIYCKMVIAGKTDMNEVREIKITPTTMPDGKRGLTIEEIERLYPAQHGMAKRGVSYVEYQVLDEDDGYPD
jgi:Zn-finger protein